MVLVVQVAKVVDPVVAVAIMDTTTLIMVVLVLQAKDIMVAAFLVYQRLVAAAAARLVQGQQILDLAVALVVLAGQGQLG